jgi:N6-adenosine-specific RNA methylase IME4
MTGKYNVIYADPPWSYENVSLKADDAGKEISIDGRYDLMTLEDLKNMPIKNIVQKDSVCFMWVTNPLLPEGLELLKAWGFKYKTMLTWKKTSCSGFWFMGITEHILFGVRGNVRAFRSGLLNFHACKSGSHSEKPHHFRDLISKAVVKSFDPPVKLELFARSRDGLFPDYEYEGWDVFGNEVNNSISLCSNPK